MSINVWFFILLSFYFCVFCHELRTKMSELALIVNWGLLYLSAAAAWISVSAFSHEPAWPLVNNQFAKVVVLIFGKIMRM